MDVKRLEDDGADRFRLRFEIKDTGIGIRPEGVDKIFRKYQQASSSTTRDYGGTGLGLAICKLLTEAMEGAIGVNSVWGEGSTFWFELPFERPPVISYNSSEASLAEVEQSVQLHILIAEDNKVNQKLAAALLRRLGHRTMIASNGLEALELVEQTKFDLVLMDVQMVSSALVC